MLGGVLNKCSCMLGGVLNKCSCMLGGVPNRCSCVLGYLLNGFYCTLGGVLNGCSCMLGGGRGHAPLRGAHNSNGPFVGEEEMLRQGGAGLFPASLNTWC